MGEMTKQDRVSQFLATGNLDAMSDEERTAYYLRVCETLELNPSTRPFDFIKLNGKTQLYAKKDATDQLRKRDGISLTVVSKDVAQDVLSYTVRAERKDGRKDEDMGAVNIKGLVGEALANAHMKCLTKAKRRATLSICGLGFLDELEVATIPSAQVMHAELEQKLRASIEPRKVEAPVDWDTQHAHWKAGYETCPDKGAWDKYTEKVAAFMAEHGPCPPDIRMETHRAAEIAKARVSGL